MSLTCMPDWLFFALVLFGLGYGYLKWTHGYWRRRRVPFVRPKLFFGSFKDVCFAKKCVGDIMEDIYWDLEGKKIGGFYRFHEPMLMVRDPEMIKNILMKDVASFSENAFSFNEDLDPLLTNNPFFLSGEKWKKARTQLSPAFSSGKIKLTYPIMEEVCKEMDRFLVETAPSYRADGVDTNELTAKFTTEVVAQAAFGIKGNSFKDPNAELRKIGRMFLEPSLKKNFETFVSFFLPRLATILRISFISKELDTFFRKILTEVIEFREKQEVPGNDVMNFFLQMKHKGKVPEDGVSEASTPDKSDFTNEKIIASSLMFFTDGFITSSIVVSFALYELAINPDVQERLRVEVEEVLQHHGGSFTYEAVQKMSYLDKVVQETLRLHPPFMELDKRCTKPYDLETRPGRTMTLQPGVVVVIPSKAMNGDPKYYPEPNVFDPERFSEEQKKSRPPCVFLPFGDGPRMCIGMRFAMAQIKVGVAYLVRNFEIKKTSKTPIPVIQDPKAFFSYSKGGMWLDFVKRNN